MVDCHEDLMTSGFKSHFFLYDGLYLQIPNKMSSYTGTHSRHRPVFSHLVNNIQNMGDTKVFIVNVVTNTLRIIGIKKELENYMFKVCAFPLLL